jgi:hypothetical protein
MNRHILKYSIEEAAVKLDTLVDAAIAGELVVIEVCDGVGVQLIPIEANPCEAGHDGQ